MYLSPGIVPTSLGGGGVLSGNLGSGSVPNDALASGVVTWDKLGSGSVRTSHMGSGSVLGQLGATPHIASGTLAGFELGSGSILSGRIASGQIGFGHLANGSVQSGSVASGVLARMHMASGCVVDFFVCEQAISGIRAVAWGSGGCSIVLAERHSGLRLPAFGIAAGNYVSGDSVPVVTAGFVGCTFSGGVASGQFGRLLYVGSGGLLVNLSGYMEGASSGTGPNPVANTGEISGCLVQPVAVSVSGGVYVRIGDPRSGLLSGLLGQY